MTHVFHPIAVRAEQVVHCSFSQWYPQYKQHTVESVVIPLTPGFLEYLDADGIVLPGGGAAPGYEDVHRQVVAVFENGRLYTPKLNWSAPKDAAWIMLNKTMECRSADDVYLLLKSSLHVQHDLHHAFDETEGAARVAPELVLRKWVAMNPALEFRVFVRRGAIVGVSQRDLNHYEYLAGLRADIGGAIDRFFSSVLASFPDADFVFDVYVPRPFHKVWLVDINPFLRTSELYLFTWHELSVREPSECEFRVVESANVGRFAAKDHSENQVPKDVVDASVDTAKMVELAREWQRRGAGESESESESDD